MAFKMTSKIDIGKYVNIPTHSFKWTNSTEAYCNSAEIVIPALSISNKDTYGNSTNAKAGIPTNQLIEAGMMVTVACGYNGINKPRFTGFVVSTNIRKNLLVITCEGYSYKLRNKEFRKSYLNTTVRQILLELIQGTGIKLHKDIPNITLVGGTSLDKNAQIRTALDVLEYFKTRCLLTTFFIDNVLYVGPAYLTKGDEVKFKMGWNVVEADSLIFQEAVKPYSIKLTTRKSDGTEVSVVSGEGTELNYKVSGIHDKAILKKIASDINLKKSGRYSGSFTAFLEPIIRIADAVNLDDPQYKYRKGRYYVESVEGSFGPSGGRQKVSISIKLDDETVNDKIIEIEKNWIK